MSKIRVMLVDDHILLRSGLKLLLENDISIKVVAEASDGFQALQVAEDARPDIIVLDLSMPNMDGLECIKELKSRGIGAKIIVLSMYDDEHYICEVLRAGAQAYVQKGSVDTELFRAIKEVRIGKRYLSQKDSQALLAMLLSDDQQQSDEQDPYILLSPREREVLKLVVRGFALKEIGDELSLSVKTVDTYKTRIMEKLNLTRKSDLVSYALKYKLLREDA